MSDELFDDFTARQLDEQLWQADCRQAGTNVQAAADSSCVQLTFPGGATVNSPRGAAEIGSRASFSYGRFSTRMKAARCEPEAETVSSFYTYWHGQDPRGNNHEIDVEILGSEPEIIYLTVWTHADHQSGRQRRITRVVDLRDGSYKQSTLSGEGFIQREHPLAPPAFPIAGRYDFSFADFDASEAFYTYGFEWREQSVRYTIEIGGQPYLLWDLREPSVIPSQPAPVRANLWWSDVHWNRPAAATPPAKPVRHQLDFIRVEPLDR